VTRNRTFGVATLAGLAALALATATPAIAGTLSIAGDSVVFQAAPGEANEVTASYTFNTGLVLIVRDQGAPITAGPGCVAALHRAVCPLPPRTMQISAGDRNDSFNVGGAAVTFDGGTGNDSLTATGGAVNFHGGDGSDTVVTGDSRDELYGDQGNDKLYAGGTGDWYQDDLLVGGDGNDTLRGGDGDDVLEGGPGDDNLDGGGDGDDLRPGPGADVVHGGANRTSGLADPETGNNCYLNGLCQVLDSLSYRDRTAPVSVTLDGLSNDGGTGEGDNVFPDVELIVGGLGDDTLNAMTAPCCVSPNPSSYILVGGDGNDALIGGNGVDSLIGNDGDDILRGNGGADGLRGDNGNDTIFARDGVGDDIDCWLGIDSAQIDAGLDGFDNCEIALP
jgi:Ca2+-binding RTX toxin-like protein